MGGASREERAGDERNVPPLQATRSESSPTAKP